MQETDATAIHVKGPTSACTLRRVARLTITLSTDPEVVRSLDEMKRLEQICQDSRGGQCQDSMEADAVGGDMQTESSETLDMDVLMGRSIAGFNRKKKRGKRT